LNSKQNIVGTSEADIGGRAIEGFADFGLFVDSGGGIPVSVRYRRIVMFIYCLHFAAIRRASDQMSTEILRRGEEDEIRTEDGDGETERIRLLELLDSDSGGNW
jgi:hypothetical protein